MTDESQLQVRPKDGDSSLSLSKVRSGLIARGRRDAAMLAVPERIDRLSETRQLAAAWLTEHYPDWEKEGDAEAQHDIGFELTESGYDTEAVRWWRKAADQRHAESQFSLGNMYWQGAGVMQDYAEAARWYRKAAEQGNALAQYRLGYMYEKGQGVPQDNAEASRWNRKAADQGIPAAQYNLGVMYAEGQGVAQDYAEAVRWHLKAAEQGDYFAAEELVDMYLKGQWVPQDYVQAHMWLNLSSAIPSGVEQQRRVKARDALARMMTSQQIAEAQRLAREWKRATRRKDNLRQSRPGDEGEIAKP